ncbi:HlyD family secretion protein [Ignatzschineria cameli]|uniref:efflux RND transporter periplasmic adaptor subunit n=1 Tax=Ignatzschineria cameli TaxID=2182793 RepID=UPI000D60D775|nr:HlyD family secretion protein [Ignatzschineria cameli]PWD85657.1 HlyD family secretion protein [Ignatzschineria cameli]
MKNALKRYLITVIAALILIVVAFQLWNFYVLGGWTRDGKIRADVIQVSAQVSGKIVNLPIIDNQLVDKGDLLFEIDPIDYEINLRNAETQLEQLRIRQEQAALQYERRTNLGNVAAISKEHLDDVKYNLDLLNDQVQQAEIAVEKAKLDLSRTQIYAEVSGYITNMNIREGSFIPAGQPLFALVDKNSFHAVGYFEETKLPYIEVGRRVEIIPYNGGEKMYGYITGYGRAIFDQSAQTGEQLLQAVKPNYPWVTLAQRIPVKVAFEENDEELEAHNLIAGTTVTIIVLDEMHESTE